MEKKLNTLSVVAMVTLAGMIGLYIIGWILYQKYQALSAQTGSVTGILSLLKGS